MIKPLFLAFFEKVKTIYREIEAGLMKPQPAYAPRSLTAAELRSLNSQRP